MLDFVKRTDVSKLGALGFLLVLYTVVKLLGAIEHSFNDIWGVRKALETSRGRSPTTSPPSSWCRCS